MQLETVRFLPAATSSRHYQQAQGAFSRWELNSSTSIFLVSVTFKLEELNHSNPVYKLDKNLAYEVERTYHQHALRGLSLMVCSTKISVLNESLIFDCSLFI